MSVEIPQPRGLPVLGNIRDIDPQNSLISLTHLAEKYGPIYKLNILGNEHCFISSVDLLNEICDEKRFHKAVVGGLLQLRSGIGDGLFTAFHGEHNWGVAHRVLTPVFGPLGVREMFDEMHDLAAQLVAKWARTNGKVNVTDDFTRLTLDSIALCAMDTRFNSFYSERMHPFVGAMMGFLAEAASRETRTKFEYWLRPGKIRKYREDIALMQHIAREIINKRRTHPSEKRDLLNAMLFHKDPQTGENMTDESIINNMITFLAAGHETTSGLLSFAIYYMAKHPEISRKAQVEVDEVVGKGPVKLEHISRLPYLEAILRETLRLQPTAPGFTVEPNETSSGPVILGGKYHIPQHMNITALLQLTGRDQVAFGSDAEEFNPERMSGKKFSSLPTNSWKPFGNGARGCIGRSFAWQESLLAAALILQNFELRLDDPAYQLRIKETLTIKPDGLYIQASLRKGIDPIQLERRMFAECKEQIPPEENRPTPLSGPVKAVTILYGSNSGTCENLAQNLARSAGTRGFKASVKSMDDAVDNLPVDDPLVVITASYEGNAPDNAASFIEWLQAESMDATGLKYAVFGCGHHEWVTTYQKIPVFVDEQLRVKGGSRIAVRGECDVGNGSILDDFDLWQDKSLWPGVSQGTANCSQSLDVRINTNVRASHLKHGLQDALVLKNDVLTSKHLPEKRVVELRLPTGMSYEAGDYLALLPINDNQVVSRVMRLFGLPWDATMMLGGDSHSVIPPGQEFPVTSVLEAYVELNTPATRKNLATISSFAQDDYTRQKVSHSIGGDGKRSPSVLDILESIPQIRIPFGMFLSMLTQMRIRRYSISSSPLYDPSVASITFSIANRDPLHLGVATNYLKSLRPGSTIQVAVKKSHASFHLPLEDHVPIIMIGTGSGLGPFRGFIQERVAKIEDRNTRLGQALLFAGCRSPVDKLYAEEFGKAERIGAVKIFYSFSRAAHESENCPYVQDRLWRERKELNTLFEAGAHTYICGSGAMSRGVADAFAKIAVESAEQVGKTLSHVEALRWWHTLRGERYAVDVFD